MKMQYKITIKKSLDTIAEGTLVLDAVPSTNPMSPYSFEQKMDEIVFDLESRFNSPTPGIQSASHDQYRVHIERNMNAQAKE